MAKRIYDSVPIIFFLALATSVTCKQNLVFAQDLIPSHLEEVIVTANRKEESLQDAPVSVSAFSQSQMKAMGITETSDMMGSLPNLHITSPYGRAQPNFTIRGIGMANEFNANAASPIGVHVDEVYQSFRASHGQQLYDLERIEVVRGPQGTLYGRNTTGGAVNIVTRKPTLGETNGYLVGGYGSYDRINLEFAAETSLIEDVLGVRVAFAYGDGDGYSDNIFDGKEYDTLDSLAGRVSVLWVISDVLSADLKLYTAKNEPMGNLAESVGVNSGFDNFGYSRAALGLDDDEFQIDTQGKITTESDGVVLTLTWDISDSWSMTSITGSDDALYKNNTDCDGSPLSLCAFKYKSDSESLNQDVRFSYESEKFHFIGGVYFGEDEIITDNKPDFYSALTLLGVPNTYFNPPVPTANAIAIVPDPSNPCGGILVNPNGFFDVRAIIPACGIPLSPIVGFQHYEQERESWAVYGEGTYTLSEDWEITVGLRHTEDDIEMNQARTILTDASGAIRASTIPYSFPYDPDLSSYSTKDSSDSTSGRLIIKYSISNDVNTYISYSRGYRAGTYNGLAYQDVSQIYFVEPEKLDSIEVGLKSLLFDNTLKLNTAIFRYDYENQQVQEVIGPIAFLRNVNGEVYGGELELEWQANYNLKLDLSVGVTESKYDQRVNGALQSLSGIPIGGNEFPYAPATSGSLGIEWLIAESQAGSWSLNIHGQYMGEFWFDPFNDRQSSGPVGEENPSYWLIHSNLSYETEAMTASLWVRNLTDEHYYVFGINLEEAFGLDYLSRGAPRLFGVDVSWRF